MASATGSSLPPPARAAATWQILLALAGVYLIWGSTYFATRVAMVDAAPLLFTSTRFLIAGTLMFVFLRLRGAPSPSRREWLASSVLGLLMPALGSGMVVFAQQWVDSSIAAVALGSTPLWTALLAAAFGARPRWQELVGVCIGTGGVVLLNFDGSLRASPLGATLLLLAPLSWALGTVLSRRLPIPRGPMATSLQMLVGGTLLAVASAAHGDVIPQQVSLRSGLAFLYLIVFGSVIGFTAYGFLLHHVRPALATSYAYVNPIVALVIGWTLGAERVGVYGLVGTAVILAAVVMVASTRKSAAPSITAQSGGAPSG